MRMTLASVLVCLLTPAVMTGQDEHPIVALVKGKLKDPAKPFTLDIRVKIKAGTNEKFEAAFAVARKETRKEKGNLAYDLNKSADDEMVYTIYERWANLEALAAHLKAAHVTKLFQDAGECFDGQPDLKVLVPVAE
jgi:quinol monooxygenase YgiN